jgi:integrase/recombinase XerD
MGLQFEAALSSYLDHLRIERGLSPNSVYSYSRDIRRWNDYLVNAGMSYEKVSSENVLDFERFLKTSKLAASSINRAVSSLKGFYKYLNLEYTITNPTSDIEALKVPRKLPKALTISEITSLIDSSHRTDDPISLRDKAILELLYSSGARVSEIVGINFADLTKSSLEDQEITTLKLRGKGSKERIVPIGKYAVVALEDYFVRTRPALAEKSSKAQPALFLNQRGERISRQSIWNIVTEAAEATGLSGRVSPHVFRHSYATHLLDGGADVRVVQELLGHASVTTTQIYTLVTIDRVRESYSAAHPRAK